MTKIEVKFVQEDTGEKLARRIEFEQNTSNKVCKGSHTYYDSTEKKHCSLIFYEQSLESQDTSIQTQEEVGDSSTKSTPKPPFKLTPELEKKWAGEKPTQKQINLLKKHKVKIPNTKLEAYQMINNYIKNQQEI